MKDLDLGTELRQLMQTYNMGLGQNARCVVGSLLSVKFGGTFGDVPCE